jgi:hypothetical protein
MVTREALDAALAAHAEWKRRLEQAVASGQSEFKPEVVQTDNACQFGKWLYGLPTGDQETAEFKNVRSLHADFHKITGEILGLALNGKQDAAREKLGFGGPYGSASGKLVLAIQSWKSKVK